MFSRESNRNCGSRENWSGDSWKTADFKIFHILYHNRREIEESGVKKLKATFVSFERLLKELDAVTAYCTLTADTHHMSDIKAFEQMKKSVVFVNITRGKLVDEAALVEALEINTSGQQ